ncbi:MAG: LuxR family transcriptional regulator [Opitutus sp.]|nr:LuxR family transcriptional regulator [Opitutus sp.]
MTATLALPDAATVLHTTRAQRVLLGLHRAMDFNGVWAALQRLLETLAPHDTMVMSVNYVDWRREATTRRLTSGHSRVLADEKTSRLVVEEGRHFFQPFLEKNPGIPVYHHTQVMAPEKIPDTRYYQRVMTPFGWRYSAHLLFWREEKVETAIALRRRPEQGDFTPVEMEVMRALHPHIAVAFERVKIFEGERRRRRLLESFYRAKPEAVLFLDWDLSALYASQEGMAMCAVWNFGPKRARQFSPADVFKLPPEIAAACATLKPAWEQQAPRGAAVAPAPLSTEAASADGTSRATITLQRETGSALIKPIFIVRMQIPEGLALPSGAPEPTAGHLRARLTPNERRLAELVCAGLSNKEVAARLKRSEGSVKVQLSGVFQKLHVTSRAKLMVALR